MEIRVLRYFLAVAREGSITNASNSLHITQPTLSRQLKDLEDELGHKLFRRGSHNMSLTNEGFIFRKRAEEIIDLADKTENEFRAMGKNIAGDIYIGGGETDAIKLLADVIRGLRNDYPDIRYHLFSGNAADVMERLDKGFLDFGIIIQPANLTKYDCLHIPAAETWGVVMRKDAPLASKSCVTKEDLAKLPLILSRQAIEDKKEGNEFIKWFGGEYESLNIVTTFNLIFNAAILVEKGIGYAVSIDKLVNTSEDSPLCFRPLEPGLCTGLDIIWRKDQLFSPAAELFMERLTDSFKQKAPAKGADNTF